MAVIVDRGLVWCAGNGDRFGGVTVDSTRARSISERALEMKVDN